MSKNQMLFKIAFIDILLLFKFNKNFGLVVFIYKTLQHLFGCIYL